MLKNFMILIAAGGVWWSCIALTLAAESQPPNVLVFLVDDMGVMDTSVPFLTDSEGNPTRYPLNDFYRTPNMERLAASGIRFNQFCAMSVCSPTRVSLMTGQNAARHRTTNWINANRNNGGPSGPPEWNWQGLKSGDVTLAKLLQQAGYRTIHVGKGHFGPKDSEGAEPTNLGFAYNIGGTHFGSPGSYYAKDNFTRGGQRDFQSVPHLEKYHGTDIFLTEALTREAKSQLSAAVEAEQPFFLYMAHYAVHSPFQADPRFLANYAASGKSPQAQAFATLIEGMDKSLGDLLDHLQELGVAENTIVFFLGDNGSDAPLGHQHTVASAAPLRGKKGSHYEGGTRVPFIAAWAAASATNEHQQRLPIGAGKIQTQLASVEDLFPTVLAIAGAPCPEQQTVDGQSLAKLLTGEPDPQRAAEFLMHYPHSPHRSDYFTTFRDQDWKVIYHYFPSEVSGGSHYQLFHLASDPYEQHDLAQQRPEELRRMMSALIAALEAKQALYPVDGERGEPLRPKLPE